MDEKYRLVKETIGLYPDQLKQAWDEIKNIAIPDEYRRVKNIVFSAMGGSALGARIAESVTFENLKIPFKIYNDYRLPDFVNRETLVIVSSYSGTTEETLQSLNDAIQKGSKVFGITTGGKLADKLQKNNFPAYIFGPKHNPSGQPRMSIGYASGAVFSLLSQLGLIHLTGGEIENTVSVMHKVVKRYVSATNKEFSPTFFAQQLKGRIPILVASEHLLGSSHTIKNQFNESAKTFCALFDIPELNHHLMEGLKNPEKLREYFTFVFIESDLYSERVRLRYPLTKEVVGKNDVNHLTFCPQSKDKLSQAYEVIIFGSLVVYNLTRKYSIDPMEIPWVDYFKAKLSSRR